MNKQDYWRAQSRLQARVKQRADILAARGNPDAVTELYNRVICALEALADEVETWD